MSQYDLEDDPARADTSTAAESVDSAISTYTARLIAAPGAASAIYSAAAADLRARWDAARDDEERAIVSAAWDHFDGLYANTTAVHGDAAALAHAAEQVVQQRDQALDELNELVTALDTHDFDHPKLSEVYEDMQENIEGSMLEGWYEMEAEGFYDDANYNLRRTLGMSRDEADIFINAVREGTWGVTIEDCDKMLDFFTTLRDTLIAKDEAGK